MTFQIISLRFKKENNNRFYFCKCCRLNCTIYYFKVENIMYYSLFFLSEHKLAFQKSTFSYFLRCLTFNFLLLFLLFEVWLHRVFNLSKIIWHSEYHCLALLARYTNGTETGFNLLVHHEWNEIHQCSVQLGFPLFLRGAMYFTLVANVSSLLIYVHVISNNNETMENMSR